MTPPQVPQHLCHAVGCNVRVLPARLMCPRHWFMVPKPLRTLVWRYYTPGQEVTKNPSPKYLEVARLAINDVARQEGQRQVPDNEEIIKTLERLIAEEKAK